MKTIGIVVLALLAPTAWAEVVVIAHPDVPVQQIDNGQATQIFLKQTSNWSDGKAIQPVDAKAGSAVRDEFYSRVTGRNQGQMRAYWARQMFTGMGYPPKEAASSQDVVKLVSQSPGAVGYAAPDAVDASVKVILDTRKP